MASTPADHLEQIESLLRNGRCGPRLSVSRYMDRETWDRKVEELGGLIAEQEGAAGRPLIPKGQVA